MNNIFLSPKFRYLIEFINKNKKQCVLNPKKKLNPDNFDEGINLIILLLSITNDDKPFDKRGNIHANFGSGVNPPVLSLDYVLDKKVKQFRITLYNSYTDYQNYLVVSSDFREPKTFLYEEKM